ncbi:MAG: helix-turn-helix domain-containing protein [Aliiglaciecola sp.]|uniref:helix-turn-helix transcriptional regulator n=1 Tax=Aliiglaciecola sp. TaxID=1872441 RepID=UPI003297B690
MDLVSANELIKTLGVTDGTIRRYVEKGALPPPIRVGVKRYWTKSDLTEFFESRREKLLG